MLKKQSQVKIRLLTRLLTMVVFPISAVLVVPGIASAATSAACDSTANKLGWSNNCTIYPGNVSNMVVAIQYIVSGACGGSGLAIDGNFGPSTEHAVECFQHQNGLTQDGIVGSATWKKLQGSTEFYKDDGNWEYDFAAVENPNGPELRIWIPSGICYVLFAGKYVQMNLNAPGQ